MEKDSQRALEYKKQYRIKFAQSLFVKSVYIHYCI